MKREVLKTFLALSTSASVTLKHIRILEGGREGGREGNRCIHLHVYVCMGRGVWGKDREYELTTPPED